MASLKNIVSVVLSMLRIFRDQIPVSELLKQLFFTAFSAVDNAIRDGRIVDQQTVDAFLDTIDMGLGQEATAKDVIKDLPDDKEEELTDHIIEAVRIYAYCRLKIEGYTVEDK